MVNMRRGDYKTALNKSAPLNKTALNETFGRYLDSLSDLERPYYDP